MSGISGVSTRGNDYGDMVFVDKSESQTELTAEDFLLLMVAQLQNQDFMNPLEDTQYISQMAQFATMQQMTELASYSKQNYVMSLVGKTVTAARFKVNGDIEKVTGVVDKISLVDNEYRVHIGDKSFSLEQIMELGESPSTEPDDSVDYDQSAFLLSLVGKQVTIKDDDEEEITGTVSRISLQDGMKLMVGDKWYTLDQLVSVDQIEQETPTEPETPENGEGGAEEKA